jgi:hypothetical protein
LQDGIDAFGKRIVEFGGFQFHDQGYTAADGFEDLFKRGDLLVRAGETVRFQFFKRTFLGLFIDAAHTREGVVVEDDYLIVLGEANVKLDTVSLTLCGVECLHRVFHSEIAVKSAVGVVYLEGLDRGLGLGTGTEEKDVER